MSTWAIVALIGAMAVVALIFWAVRIGRKGAMADERKKEIDAFEDEMDRVGRANQARSDAERRARAGQVSDDPNNRDTWGV